MDLFHLHMYEDTLLEFAGEGDDLLVLKGNRAVSEGKEGIVGAPFDILTGMKLGAALADDNLARADSLATEAFNAKAFGNGIATELG